MTFSAGTPRCIDGQGPASSDDAPWLIVGAGALGQLFAASLAAFRPVILLGRNPARPPIRLRKVDGTDVEITLERERLKDWIAKRGEYSAPALVVLATKSHDTRAALDALTPSLAPTTPLLLLQNGFQVQPRISEHWTGPVLCASTTEAAYRPMPEPGPEPEGDSHSDFHLSRPDVVHAAAGETWIGDLAGRHAALATVVADDLSQAGIAATACADIRQRLWQKLAINAVINPLTASHGVRNGELARAEFRPRIEALISEIDRIMRAEGIKPPAAGWQALIDGVIEATATNRSSMLQDVLAGRPTERDAILWPLIDAGLRHELATPALTELYRARPA
ncbi:ketopantoate reductase family protein [Salinicola halophyticus]|uniref:ketopantoate reductase family protein n=1 Tax=Salinicola halophyticus TaxID=1808881 RepID=UPI000DA22D3C|nr:ketopantoate reductase family protein [Salinicola halophyticus]